jgi:hypothetical protein
MAPGGVDLRTQTRSSLRVGGCVVSVSSRQFLVQTFARAGPASSISHDPRMPEHPGSRANTTRSEKALFPGPSEVGGTGLEPVTPSLSSWCSPN